MTRTKEIHTSYLNRTTALKKLSFCASFAISIFVILLALKFETKNSLMISWDAFSFSMIILSWIVIFTTNADQLCLLVKKQDESLPVIFIIVLISVFFSLFGTLAMVMNASGNVNTGQQTIISLVGVGLSWILLHTIFVFRYAHLYHDHNKLKTGSNIGGVEFPGKNEPAYFDFAYFSFVIGMTFQVSDVLITSSTIRRFVLLHGLISFTFNTIILALTINTIANLKI